MNNGRPEEVSSFLFSQALAAEADVAGLPREELQSLQRHIDARRLQQDAEALCDRAKCKLQSLHSLEQQRAVQATSNGTAAPCSGSNGHVSDSPVDQVSRILQGGSKHGQAIVNANRDESACIECLPS